MLAANFVAAFAFMLAYYAYTMPFAMAAALAACTSCTTRGSVDIVLSHLEGAAVALILAPFAGVVMLPLSLLLAPLARLVIARVERRLHVLLIGASIGAVLGWPLLLFLYAGQAPGSSPFIDPLMTMEFAFMLPSAMAGAAYVWVLTSRIAKRLP